MLNKQNIAIYSYRVNFSFFFFYIFLVFLLLYMLFYYLRIYEIWILLFSSKQFRSIWLIHLVVSSVFLIISLLTRPIEEIFHWLHFSSILLYVRLNYASKLFITVVYCLFIIHHIKYKCNFQAGKFSFSFSCYKKKSK